MVLMSMIFATLIISSHISFSREALIVPEECNTAICQETARYLLDSMDTAVDPCEDFYRYSCGGWIERHPIPGDKTLFREFDILTDVVSNRVSRMLKRAANEIHPRAVYDAANLFLGCIDEEAREAEGLEPLKGILNMLGGWPMAHSTWSSSGYQWQETEAVITRLLGLPSIIAVGVGLDDENTSQHIINLNQPSFFLGREEILNLTSELKPRVYRDYIVSTAKLINPDADEILVARDAEEMIYFESALSRLTRPKEEKRDVRSWYHKMTISEVKRLTEDTNFDWTDFLNDVFENLAIVTDETEVIFAEIDYTKKAIKLAQETNPRVLANYLGWNLLKKVGPHTTKKFRENEFELDRVITGLQEDEKLEDVCMRKTTELLEYAVGRLYVDKYFSGDKKSNVEQMVEDIRTAYGFTLMENTWMDDYTKTKTLQKLNAMAVQVGYPSWIKNDRRLNKFYSGFPPVRRNKYFKYYIQITSVLTKKALGRANQPMTAHTREVYSAPPTEINAYYHAQLNTMRLMAALTTRLNSFRFHPPRAHKFFFWNFPVPWLDFPAGILDSPLYRYGVPSALNYGGLGSVIGHEIGHGFDDQGSQYDAQGNLVNWWSDETKVLFNRKADCFRDQYSNYVEPLTNMTVDANNTIGENIGDNGGIRNAYIAYKIHQTNSIRNGGHADERLPGVSATSDQLFFLGYSTVYCEVARKEIMHILLSTDPHSPSEIRVLGGLSNSREFAEAFNCPSGSRMNPASKCILW